MANDFLTLEEIKGQHNTMVESVQKKLAERSFPRQAEAYNYVMWAIDKALKNLGVHINAKMPEKIVQRIMDVKKLMIEQKEYEGHAGTWIYIDDELQYFVSDPYQKAKQIIIHRQEWFVRTNVC